MFEVTDMRTGPVIRNPRTDRFPSESQNGERAIVVQDSHEEWSAGPGGEFIRSVCSYSTESGMPIEALEPPVQAGSKAFRFRVKETGDLLRWA